MSNNNTLQRELGLNVEKKIDTIVYYIDLLGDKSKQEIINDNFTKARRYYKQIEPFVEYYYQGLSRRINGPALPEIEIEDNRVVDPSGFQVIEEIIFSDSIDFVQLRSQSKILKTDLLFIKNNFKELPIQDHHFYELLQHQIIRIATLGITGFDSPVSFQSIQEAGFAIEGIAEYYIKYCELNNKKISIELNSRFFEINKYLTANTDFDQFNRLEFISKFLVPLSKDLKDEFQEVVTMTSSLDSNKVFYGSLEDLMNGKNLQPDKFSPFQEAKMTPEKIQLGKVLFNDNILSKSNKLSCGTCHQPANFFADQNVTSRISVHNNSVSRNSPSVLYAAFQKSFFYDLRSQDLENQIESVMSSDQEFNIKQDELEARVKLNPLLMEKFKKAYPRIASVSTFEIKNAIASYVRSLMQFESRFDKYFKYDSSLTDSEINGFNLFAGKAKCATCHFIPLFNGTIPPWYNTSESEVIGVPDKVDWTNAVVDNDLGRFYTSPVEQFRYSFKTPTIRNVGKTAPYMHNGVYKNLKEVIKFYERGGGNGIGMNLIHQTLPFDQLKLSESEKDDIINFLYALTDPLEK